jgi:hypothetical protein
VKSLGVKNSVAAAAISSAIHSAVGNVLGSVFTPAAKQVVTSAVNATLATTSSQPGPQSADSETVYDYFAAKGVDETQAQAAAFAYFYQCWKGKMIFTLETPWGFITDMAILNCRAEQPEETADETTFTVTFKKIRIAGKAAVSTGTLAGRATFQEMASGPVNNGVSTQTPASATQEQSWLSILSGG